MATGTITSLTDAYLQGLKTGEWEHMVDYYRPDAVFDGTVPGWHFAWRGIEQILDQLREWYPCTAQVSDVVIRQIDDTAVLAFERRWEQPGEDGRVEQVGIRQMHLFDLDAGGLIAWHRAQCAGIWDAETLARVDAEAPKV